MTYSREWEARNRAQRLAYWRARYARQRAEDLEGCRARCRAYYEAHKPDFKRRDREWRAANRTVRKVAKHLGVSAPEARALIAAIPARRRQDASPDRGLAFS